MGRNPCDGSRVVSNILRVPSRTILSRGTELVVESFLVIDTRRIRFQFICYHEWWSSPLFDVWVPYSIYQSPSLSIAVYSSGQSPTPTVCFDFLEQCRSTTINSSTTYFISISSRDGWPSSLSSLWSWSFWPWFCRFISSERCTSSSRCRSIDSSTISNGTGGRDSGIGSSACLTDWSSCLQQPRRWTSSFGHHLE